VWLDQPVRTCPTCGLGTTEPRGRRLDGRFRTLAVFAALIRMTTTLLLIVGMAFLGAGVARLVVEEARFHGGLHLGSFIGCIAAGIFASGVIVGVAQHHRGTTSGFVVAATMTIVWVWLATAEPADRRSPSGWHLMAMLLVIGSAVISGPIWHLFGRFLGRLGPLLFRRTT
jgi:hypothetical protein